MTIFKNSVRSLAGAFLSIHEYSHIPHPISPNLDAEYPLDYYIDLSPKSHYHGRFDDSGVFLHFVNQKYGWCYYPITLFNYGIAAYQNYQRHKDQIHMNRMLAQLEWACKNQEKKGGSAGTWKVDFNLSTYGLKAGWVSAMAQGLGISLLLRAWILTKEERYLDTAELAFQAFDRFVSDGGVKVKFEGKYTFYEEYPSSPPSFVFNGFISSILGVRDLSVFTRNKRARELWEDGIATLKFMLPFYDLGYWSRYDLRKGDVNIASEFYHKYHVTQLKLLHMLTGETVFLNFAKKFESYCENRYYRTKALIQKVIWRSKRL